MKTEHVHKDAVTKDMIISDVLKKYPDISVIMLEFGLHCVGCHANIYDTIEGGSKLHGMDDETIDEMVKQINVFVGEVKKEVTPPPKDAMVTLSDAAAAKLKDLMKKEKQEGFGLKISVMPGGCSGFVYQMNFEKEPDKLDIVLTDKGVKVFMDGESLKMLAGAEVDHVDNLNESGFKINNPNAKHGCGCGKSFG
ncbi:iron-sulfur cluster assembly accessory protein [Candidatus Woesearchaeota archaeon]|nr:iron-sulfur cluster assembly accessory protein [Candidatus Woesearchaeota archaeon]